MLTTQQFSMKFTRGDTVVTFEKLWYMQRAHAERYTKSDTAFHGPKIKLMTNPVLQILRNRDWIDSRNCVLSRHAAESYITRLVQLDARNYTNAPEFIERNKYFFQAPNEQNLLTSKPSGHLHHMSKDMSSVVHQDEVLQQVLSNLEIIPPDEWTTDRIREVINAIITEKTNESLKILEEGHFPDAEKSRKLAAKSWSKLVHGYIRWAIAAGVPGPDGTESMAILGREETLSRLRKALRILNKEPPKGIADLRAKTAEAHTPIQNP
jgi:glutamyl-tRNA synthetase